MNLYWNSIANPLLGDLRVCGVIVEVVDGWFESGNLFSGKRI